jgi:hypothetical protein
MCRDDIYASICELMGMPMPGRVPTCVCAPCTHTRNRTQALKELLAAAKDTLDLLDRLDDAEDIRVQLLEARENTAWEQAKAACEQAVDAELHCHEEMDADDAELLLHLQAFVARVDEDEKNDKDENDKDAASAHITLDETDAISVPITINTTTLQEEMSEASNNTLQEESEAIAPPEEDMQQPPAKRNCTRLAAHKTLAERRDAESTLSIYHQMQRDLALCPPNLQLYGCDYCLVRTTTAYDRDEHLAGHLQFD